MSYATVRPTGDSHVIAALPPDPGYPEGIAVTGNTMYVTTAARFGSGLLPPAGPPQVQAFDTRTGALVNHYSVMDKVSAPGQDHGFSGEAFDSAGRLYVLDTQWGVVRFDPATARTRLDPNIDRRLVYASAFPDLHPCTPLQASPCSPTVADAPPLPNDIVFAPDGNAYVTDSLQATIWRIPPGGGRPQVWFQDPRLGGGFGPNGIRLNPAKTRLTFVVSSGSASLPDNPALGHIYTLPLGPAVPTASDLQELHRYTAAELPDDLAFGRSGMIYVTLFGSNQISALRSDGTEVARFSGPATAPSGNVPYDMPSGIAFDDPTGSLLANNHSEVLGIPSHFVVFDVFVHDRADPLVMPHIP